MTYRYTKIENKKRKLPSYLNDEEYLNLLKQVKSNKFKLAFNLAYNSGLRISEIVKLKKEDLDLNGKRIFIRDSKWGKDRVVPLPKRFPQSYIKYIPFKYKNIPSGIRAIQYAFQRCFNKSNIQKKGVSFHSLRHSFAVRCMERGIPLNQIQVLLGHESIATTSIYLKINPKDALDNYENLW